MSYRLGRLIYLKKKKNPALFSLVLNPASARSDTKETQWQFMSIRSNQSCSHLHALTHSHACVQSQTRSSVIHCKRTWTVSSSSWVCPAHESRRCNGDAYWLECCLFNVILFNICTSVNTDNTISNNDNTKLAKIWLEYLIVWVITVWVISQNSRRYGKVNYCYL